MSVSPGNAINYANIHECANSSRQVKIYGPIVDGMNLGQFVSSMVDGDTLAGGGTLSAGSCYVDLGAPMILTRIDLFVPAGYAVGLTVQGMMAYNDYDLGATANPVTEIGGSWTEMDAPAATAINTMVTRLRCEPANAFAARWLRLTCAADVVLINIDAIGVEPASADTGDADGILALGTAADTPITPNALGDYLHTMTRTAPGTTSSAVGLYVINTSATGAIYDCEVYVVHEQDRASDAFAPENLIELANAAEGPWIATRISVPAGESAGQIAAGQAAEFYVRLNVPAEAPQMAAFPYFRIRASRTDL